MKVRDYLIAKDNIVKRAFSITYRNKDVVIVDRKELLPFKFKKNKKYLISYRDEKNVEIICEGRKVSFSLQNCIIFDPSKFSSHEYYENIFYNPENYNLKQNRKNKLNKINRASFFRKLFKI